MYRKLDFSYGMYDKCRRQKLTVKRSKYDKNERNKKKKCGYLLVILITARILATALAVNTSTVPVYTKKPEPGKKDASPAQPSPAQPPSFRPSFFKYSTTTTTTSTGTGTTCM